MALWLFCDKVAVVVTHVYWTCAQLMIMTKVKKIRRPVIKVFGSSNLLRSGITIIVYYHKQ